MTSIRPNLKVVFTHVRYVQIAVLTGVFVFMVAIWLPNISLLISYVGSGATFLDKVRFLGSAFATLGTAHSVFSALSIIVLSVLSGIQIALLAYYSHQVRNVFKGKRRHHASGYLAVTLGVVGVGCATCGSVILTSLLATVGAGGLLLFLPLEGLEVSLVAIFILGASIYVMLQKINKPFTCTI